MHRLVYLVFLFIKGGHLGIRDDVSVEKKYFWRKFEGYQASFFGEHRWAYQMVYRQVLYWSLLSQSIVHRTSIIDNSQSCEMEAVWGLLFFKYSKYFFQFKEVHLQVSMAAGSSNFTYIYQGSTPWHQGWCGCRKSDFWRKFEGYHASFLGEHNNECDTVKFWVVQHVTLILGSKWVISSPKQENLKLNGLFFQISPTDQSICK